MSARGFTLVELAIVLSIGGLLAPLVWMSGRSLEAEHRDSLGRAAASREMRALSEELRRDLRTLRWQGAEGLVLVGPAPCDRVEYTLAGEVLERRAPEACGGARVVAAPVRRIARAASRLEVVFAHHAGRDLERDTPFVAIVPAQEAP
jgi:prepilin-type N-terminal cleavage/methylation domain-containing protein